MIIAFIFQALGCLLFRFEVEVLISGTVIMFAVCAAVAGFQYLAALLLVLGAILYIHLRDLQPKYSTSGYGVFSRGATEKLHAPPQVRRTELRADQGSSFRDCHGRRLLLRGVNLSGSSKFPIGQGTHITDNFYNTDSISFVGRPFALTDADDHFSRLRAWGFTLVRLLVTWEAVEHKGPDEYDEEYLDYLLAIVRKARTHGISCLIDPHQDVWSRWTGGDGAPAWTLDYVGFDISSLHASGAAFTHQGHLAENGADATLPRMTWPSNHHKLAAGTMFTLFFAGRDFAPDLKIGDINIQDFLQDHYIAAMARVAETLAAEDNVIGFDTLNEPNLGMIGWLDLTAGSKFLKQGPSPTWFESFQLGEGIEKLVANYNPSLVPAGKCLVNSAHVRAWKTGSACVWKQHGVWEVANGQSVLLKNDYFRWRVEQGVRVPVDPSCDYFVPFAIRFKNAINTAIERRGGTPLLIFLDRNTDFEDASIGLCPTESVLGTDRDAVEGFVWAPHWYDLVPIVMKSFRSWVGVARDQSWFSPPIVFGNTNLVREYCRQLLLLQGGGNAMGDNRGIPTIVGELGIPFDLNDGNAYRTGDFGLQVSAMDTSLSALDMALLSGVLWNYTPDNSNQFGDGWNGEDLSIFSTDQIRPGDEDDIFAGGRALQAIVRPYATRCAGRLSLMDFDVKTRRFILEMHSDDNSIPGAPTVIFVPFFQYPAGPRVVISDGTYRLHCRSQTLEYYHDHKAGHIHTLILTLRL